MPAPLIAVVIPVLNEHAVLPKLFARLAALFDSQRDCAWRAVLVDDGSRDDSAALVRAQAARDARFELVELSRNFGFQAALAAGLAHARSADAVVTMDADLQDPPEVIPALVSAWRDGAEVVRATRRTRADTGLRRAGFDLFHAIFGRLSDYPIEPKTGTFGLLGRAAVGAFHQLPERNRFFPGLRAWIGFPTADVPYDRHERAAGKPQQTFRRLVRYGLDGVFSFSRLPLRLLTYSGIFVGFVGFCLGLYYVVKRHRQLQRCYGFSPEPKGLCDPWRGTIGNESKKTISPFAGGARPVCEKPTVAAAGDSVRIRDFRRT